MDLLACFTALRVAGGPAQNLHRRRMLRWPPDIIIQVSTIGEAELDRSVRNPGRPRQSRQRPVPLQGEELPIRLALERLPLNRRRPLPRQKQRPEAITSPCAFGWGGPISWRSCKRPTRVCSALASSAWHPTSARTRRDTCAPTRHPEMPRVVMWVPTFRSFDLIARIEEEQEIHALLGWCFPL
jgi:hypothetical protein